MNQELIFETRQHQTVVRADSIHAFLGCTTELRTWVIMHTAAGQAVFGVDIFHTDSPRTACWSMEFAAEVALLEHDADLAQFLKPNTSRISA